jgi:selenocysteine lyase/cysteine desulfurase
VYSYYKTFGPHTAVLYGKKELLESIPGINHYFIDSIPYKFQPGNFNFELTYGLGGIVDYWNDFYQHHFPNGTEKSLHKRIATATELIQRHEEHLTSLVLDYLKNIDEIQIIGYSESDAKQRVSTISFIHKTMNSQDIVRQIDPFNIGIRFGDFYAKKLIEDMGLIEKNGVVRVSLVHYNTEDEVKKLINGFKTIFS